jgi:N-methylhydantoinase A/oxoprolinase/acetone carboxylase beta subunit
MTMAFRLSLRELGLDDDHTLEADTKQEMRQKIKRFFEHKNAERWAAMTDAEKAKLEKRVAETVERL